MLDLINVPSIVKITDEIREKAAKKPYIVSDVVCQKDGRELQFVDLVMEGGGTLGIALVGYIHALEQAGIRFLGIGGSSVGAIVALLAYGCGDRTEPRGEKLAGIIGGMDLGKMVDGQFFARRFSTLLGSNNIPLLKQRRIFSFIFAAPQAFKKIGLNPGDKLYEWIADRLAENGIYTLADLDILIKALPEELKHRESGAKIDKYDTSLRIVATDVTTNTKVVFPDMAAMYWQEPGEVNPASFGRASSAIPGFFQPYTVGGVSKLIGSVERWKQLGSFTGTLPDKVSFADGGLLSNFPIDLFKSQGIPRAPTLGARLGDKDRTANEIDKIGQYAWQMFCALRNCADYDFIFKNPLYNQLIAHIPTNKYNWLDFNMNDADKLNLFREGVKAGARFLDTFDWDYYKQLRAAENVFFRAQRGVKDE